MDEYENLDMQVCQRQFHVIKNTNNYGGTQLILCGIEDFAIEELCETKILLENYISHVSRERQSLLMDLKESNYVI